MPFIDLSQLQTQTLMPGFDVRFVHTDSMTFAHWEVQAGAVLPEHSHEHEQVAHVLEGEFELTIDGTARILKPGVVGVIPSHAVHSGRAITDCRIMDVFQPVREDYRT